MSRSLIERKLAEVASRLRALQDELRVADEQLQFLAEQADDLRLRALVSETPLAEREHADAQKHVDAQTRHRASLAAEIMQLEASQDDLLDRLIAETR